MGLDDRRDCRMTAAMSVVAVVESMTRIRRRALGSA
jgi:hypothetical protein